MAQIVDQERMLRETERRESRKRTRQARVPEWAEEIRAMFDEEFEDTFRITCEVLDIIADKMKFPMSRFDEVAEVPLCLCRLILIKYFANAFFVWFPRKFKHDWVQFPPEEVREEMALDFRAIKGVPNVIDLHGRLESGEIAPYQLVGDAAYPLKSYMLTPLHAPRRRLMKKWEQTYNYVQSATRMVVERTIGALKGRWRLFPRRHESKIWRVCAGTACIIILHNMLQTVSTPRMETNNPRRYIWARLPNGWWTRSGMDKYEWRSLDNPTLAELRARRHHFGKHIHRAYLRCHRVSSTAC
ncbi:unnamed protein product [Closterium sp. NIES-53]